MLIRFLIAVLILSPGTLHLLWGQDSASHSLQVSGAVDVYYAYSINDPKDQNRAYTTQAARHNEFNINWTYIKLDYEYKIIRATAALQAGTYPIFNYAEEGLFRAIAEAHAGIRLGKKVWLDAGVLPSHIGYEATFSGDNELYTRALMADGSPYFSTGLQLSVQFSDRLSFKALVINGWQNIVETNTAKSVGINLNYQISPSLEINYSNYFGNEALPGQDADYRFFNHSYLKWQISQAFRIVFSLDAGIQGLSSTQANRSWLTGMVLGQYQWHPKWAVGGRAEFFHDPDNVIATPAVQGGFSVQSYALDINYRPLPQAVIRIEGRWYRGANPTYPINDGSLTPNDFVVAASIAVRFPE